MEHPDKIKQIKYKLKNEPDLLTPSEAQNYALTVAAYTSDLRDRCGVLEAKYADIKATLIQEGNNGITSKALADGSEVGMEWAVIQQHIKGMDEIIKVLKKAIQHFENEGRNIY